MAKPPLDRHRFQRWMLGTLACGAAVCGVLTGVPRLLSRTPEQSQQVSAAEPAPVQINLTSAQRARVDPILLPLQRGELEKGLRASVNDAQGLVLWLLRADEQGQNDEGMRVMQDLRRQHPNAPQVLAAYLFELDIEIQGNHRERSVYKPWTPEQKQDFHQTLAQLYKSAPTLWLPYAIEGYRHFYLSGNTPDATQNRGISLLQKAVGYGPNVSLIHYRLASVCNLAADWQKRPALFATSITECQKALRLPPPSTQAAFFALMCYNYGWIPGQKPDKAKAAMAAKRFLAMLPPGFEFNSVLRENLAMANVPVPTA